MFNFFIKNKLKNNLKNYKKIVVWGSGGLAKTAIHYWLPQKKIKYIVDTNIKSTIKKINNLTCYQPKKLLDIKPDLIIICSSAYLEIIEYIKKHKIRCKFLYIYELFLINHSKENELANLYLDLIASKNSNLFKLFLIKPQLLVNITYRFSNFFKKYKITFLLYWFFAFFHYLLCLLLSIQLPLGVKAGPGLIIAHPGTIVFNKSTKLGSFVTIYHSCTLGTTLTGNSPIVKDFVTIYTGSQILGNTIIESHSKVGAMSLLLNFKGEKFSTIAGIPAKTKRKFSV